MTRDDQERDAKADRQRQPQAGKGRKHLNPLAQRLRRSAKLVHRTKAGRPTLGLSRQVLATREFWPSCPPLGRQYFAAPAPATVMLNLTWITGNTNCAIYRKLDLTFDKLMQATNSV